MTPRSTRVNPTTQRRSPARSFTQSLDNFYGAARDTRSEQAFQRGTSALGVVLGEQANRMKTERRQDEYTQGQADAMREAAGLELQGVKTGSIFRQHSSFYQKGLNEQRGKAAAHKFKDQLATDYQNWEGRFEDDPAAFREWLNGKNSEFLDGLANNPDMLAAAMPILSQTNTSLASSHTSFTNDRMRQEHFEAYGDVIGGMLDGYVNGDYDEETLIDAIKAEADDMYDIEGAAANDYMVDAIIQWSDTFDDPEGILTLARAHDQGKIKLSRSNMAKLENAADQLEAEIRRQDSNRDAEEKATHDAMIDQHRSSFLEALSENPNIHVRDFYRETGVEDASLYNELLKVQDNVQKANKNSDGPVGSNLLAFRTEMYQAKTIPERYAVLDKYSGILTGAQVLEQYDMLEKMQSGTSFVTDPIMKERKQNWLNELAIVEAGDGISTTDVGMIKASADTQYTELMFRETAGIAPNDYAALTEAHLKVTQEVAANIVRQFPALRENMADQPQLAAQSGLAGAQLELDAETFRKEAEEAGLRAEDTAMGQSLEAPQQELEVTPPEPEVNRAQRREQEPTGELPGLIQGAIDMFTGEGEAVVGREASKRVRPGQNEAPAPVDIVAQPEPYEDFTSDEEYDEVRSDFYGQILTSLTDGVDNRPTIQDAGRVFEEDPDFASEVARVAQKYDVDPMELVAVMHFETGGTFSPNIRNAAGSGATGLIQFMPRTAASLGTTTDALAQMSRSQQMRYVERYFDQWGSRLQGGDIDDLYMAVLWPKAIGRPDSYPLFRREQGKVYSQNAGLDTNKDGVVTKFEAAAKVRKSFRTVTSRQQPTS